MVIVVMLGLVACGSGGSSTTSYPTEITLRTTAVPPSGTNTTATPTTASSTGGALTTVSAAELALGRSIYVNGTDLSGTPIPRSSSLGMMAGGGCITCHGADGKGGTISMMMAGEFDVPDIRWSTLSQPMTMGGQTEPAYDPTTFARAVREGIGSDSDDLQAPMPQWQLTDDQINALIAYLKTL
jgi:hypothetical protein